MRNLLLVIAPLALAACNLAPQYQRPTAPISSRFPVAPRPPATAGQSAAQVSWKQFFGDDRLRTLIAAALANNRDYAQSLARVSQARAQFRIQESARLPQVGVNGGYTRQRQPLNSLPLPAGSGEGGPSAITLENWSGNAAVSSFELDLWGRVRTLSQSAKAQYLASEQGARAFRLSLIGQVSAAYYATVSAEERVKLAKRTLVGREQGVRIAKRRLDAGVTATVDYDQTVLLATQARSDLASLNLELGQSRNLLETLIGGPITGTLPAGRPLNDVAQINRVDAGLPSNLLLDRPDILQAELSLMAANADIGAARAAFFPTISLTAGFGFINSALKGLFGSDNRTWNYGGNVTLPIFDFGRRNAQVRLNRAKAEELSAAYQAAVQKAFREVADALIARREYVDQIAALQDSVAAQARLAVTARKRYDQGLSIYLEVLDAERSLFQAQQQLIDLRSQSLQNEVSLYVALGGGERGGSNREG